MDRDCNEDKRVWSERDITHYFDVLMGMDAALWHLRRVLEDHRDCAGCDLCIDAQGMQYTMTIYNDLFHNDAPHQAARRFRDEIESLEKDAELLRPLAPVPDSPAVVAPAKKPYWLA